MFLLQESPINTTAAEAVYRSLRAQTTLERQNFVQSLKMMSDAQVESTILKLLQIKISAFCCRREESRLYTQEIIGREVKRCPSNLIFGVSADGLDSSCGKDRPGISGHHAGILPAHRQGNCLRHSNDVGFEEANAAGKARTV